MPPRPPWLEPIRLVAMEEPQTGGTAPGEGEASEEELRARIEESLRNVRVQDVLLESVVTLINLTARRVSKPDERDLEQARIGIDAVRAVVELLEPEPQAQVRSALSELQMLYAREAGEKGAPAAPEGREDAPEEPGSAGSLAGPRRKAIPGIARRALDASRYLTEGPIPRLRGRR